MHAYIKADQDMLLRCMYACMYLPLDIFPLEIILQTYFQDSVCRLDLFCVYVHMHTYEVHLSSYVKTCGMMLQ